MNLNKPVQKELKMVEFNGVWSRFAAMKISGVLLCVSALLLVGCGDDGSGSDISTTKINQGSASTNTTQVATNAVAPVDISTMKFIRRTNATTVITNVVLVFFKDKEHFEAKKRFTGNAIKNNKDGTQALIPMKDGLWHGTFRIKYPGGKQTKYRVNYVQGLKSGAAYTWVPRRVLERLGHQPSFRLPFVLADGRVVQRDLTEARIRLGGQIRTRIVVLGDNEGDPLFGADSLQGFGLAVDPVNHRLVPVEVFPIGLSQLETRGC